MKILMAMVALAMALETGVVLQPPLGLDLYMPVPEANPLTRQR